MVIRALALSVRASFNKFVNNYIKEVTVVICSLCICALFWYMFSDFVNDEIANISTSVQKNISYVTAAILSLGGSVALGNFTRNEMSENNSMVVFLNHLGLTNSNIKKYQNYRVMGAVFLYSVVFILLSRHLLPLLELESITIFCLLSITLSMLIAYIMKKMPSKVFENDSGPQKYKSKNHLLLRSKLYLSTARIGKFRIFLWLVATFIFFPLLVYSSLKVNIFPLCFFALTIGSVYTLIFAELLANDLKSSDFEKILGFKHSELIKFYLLATLANSILLIIVLSIIAVVIQFIFGLPLLARHSILLLAATTTPSLLFSSLAFQIDARKPFIQVAISLLISLFVVTAAFYNIFAWLIILPIYYYASSYQQNRFYRA